jgi:sporulation protein YhbH
MADLGKIKQDHQRFKQIVRGKIKDNLRKYMSEGELTGRQGKDTVKVPVPRIDLPRFKYGDKNTGGVGSGEGEVGDIIGRGDEAPGEGGPGEAGEGEGDKALEVDVTYEELAEIMAEELELPNIEPKGQKTIETTNTEYTDIRKTGPESLRHFKRTFKEALKRQIASGEYDPEDPVVIPIKEDRRYRAPEEDTQPESNAVILYMMDVSGSMGDEQKEIVRIESFWIDTWLRHQYTGIETRYIIHDATAKEVDRHTFFHTRESGGTMISSAYNLACEILEEEYPVSEWNVYPFHFSDGDNWSVDDTKECMKILKERIVPRSNMFAYGQVESPYGSGQFIKDLGEHFADQERVTLSEIENRDAIYDSIQEFLGKGL